MMDVIAAFACGVIFCAWFTGAASAEVGAIRFPATLFLIAYNVCQFVSFVCGLLRAKQ